jgi:hypothetical protein
MQQRFEVILDVRETEDMDALARSVLSALKLNSIKVMSVLPAPKNGLDLA